MLVNFFFLKSRHTKSLEYTMKPFDLILLKLHKIMTFNDWTTSYEYMHMVLVGVRDGFISAQVYESSPSLKGEGWIRKANAEITHLARQPIPYAFSRMLQVFWTCLGYLYGHIYDLAKFFAFSGSNFCFYSQFWHLYRHYILATRAKFWAGKNLPEIPHTQLLYARRQWPIL